MVTLIEAAQLFSTLWMVGLIWFVQIVHYPLFDFVDRSLFAAFEQAHQRRTTFVVAPIMCIELGTALLWLWFRAATVPFSVAAIGATLAAALWLVTFLIQVPAHTALLKGYQANIHRWLVHSNWLRTVLWTCRGVVVVAYTLD